MSGIVIAVRVAVIPLRRPVVEPVTANSVAPAHQPASPSRDSLRAAFVARNPFRVDRGPAPVPYDPLTLAQPVATPPPRPALALVGLLWDGGDGATALVEGLPGVAGPWPLRVGESVAGITCARITTDRVMLVGLDTTWTLRVREPWQ